MIITIVVVFAICFIVVGTVRELRNAPTVDENGNIIKEEKENVKC